MSTKIEWTDESWNPVRGCTRVSKGCENCYAETQAHRFSGPGQAYEGLTVLKADGPRWTGKIRLVPEKLDEPLRWRKPRKVFVNSMSDLFHEGVPDEFIDRVFAVMALSPQHTFQILTKRPERMREFLSDRLFKSAPTVCCIEVSWGPGGICWADMDEVKLPLPNVWLGVSVEDQATADERLAVLLEVPAKVRFVSYEPALGPVDFTRIYPADAGGDLPVNVLTPFNPHSGVGHLDWVICGGESGPEARPMNRDWARQVRDQCEAAGVPFFFKQWGEWSPVDPKQSYRSVTVNTETGMVRVGKKAAGAKLDGREHREFPAPTGEAVSA